MYLYTTHLPWHRSAWQVCISNSSGFTVKSNNFVVYQTFIGAMNEKIKRQIAISNPFVFKHISNLKVRTSILICVLLDDVTDGCRMLSSLMTLVLVLSWPVLE